MKGWIMGAGVAAVAVGAGTATWAAVSFLSAGPQVAEAFPADTLAMVSIDLDPSANQKVAAFKLANRFPRLKHDLGLHSGDDVRRRLVEELTRGAGCDIDYDDDIKPWIGSSAGVGMVGAADPQPAVALAITDPSKARKGAKLLLDCLAQNTRFGEDPPSLGFAVNDHWLMIESDAAGAARVLAAGVADPLAESDDYLYWTDAAGDPGIITGYAAPGSAAPLLKAASARVGSGVGSDLGSDLGADLGSGAGALCPGLADSADGSAGSAALADFAGAGATIRFNDSGLEFEFADSAGKRAETTHAADLTTLPDQVGAAIGIGFADGWIDDLLSGLEQTCGTGFSPTGLFALISTFTGLDVPADLETLTQRSAQLVLGPDLDSDSPTTLPLALRLMGDPSTIEPVVDKISALAPGASFEAKAAEDSVTVALDDAWRDEVAAGGHLGRNQTFRSVLPHASESTSALYIDIATIKEALATLLGGSSLGRDLDALSAVGASLWPEGDINHGQLIVSVK